MIQITNLTKKYDKFVALQNANLSIPSGKIYALVGINGSGKSTLLRVLAGVFKPDEGNVYIDGEPIYENEVKKREILFLPDEPFYASFMNGNDVVNLYKAFYDLDSRILHEYISAYQLSLNIPLKNFSKGMRRRLFVSIALACSPKYLLLDEVFDGLDPNARLILKRGLVDLVTKCNSTVIMASHSLRELEDICDSYSIIDQKQILSSGGLEESLNKMHKFQIAFNRPVGPYELGFECVSFESSGKIVKIVFVGDKEKALEKINALNPLVVDEMSVDFEEMFISGVEGKVKL